jgi:hypothetical protein
MRIRPGQSLPLGFKKTVDDERIPFGRGPASAAGRLATDDSSAGVHRGKDAVNQDDFAAVRNPALIDRAMSNPQTHARGALVPPRIPVRTVPAAGPVNGNSGQQ